MTGREAGVDHDDSILIDLGHGLNKVVLPGGQIERFDIEAFRLELRRSAYDDDGSVCFRGGAYGFISELLSRLRSVFAWILAFHGNAQCITHLHTLPGSILNTLQRSYGIFGSDQ